MAWSSIAASETDANSPLNQTLMDKIRGNLDYLHSAGAQLLYASGTYTGGDATGVSIVLDSSIDWRDRYIEIFGLVTAGSDAQVLAVIPGGADDKNIGMALVQASAQTWDKFTANFMYSEQGGATYITAPYMLLSGAEANWYVWVDSGNGGRLTLTGTAFSNGAGFRRVAYNVRIIYSADRGIY